NTLLLLQTTSRARMVAVLEGARLDILAQIALYVAISKSYEFNKETRTFCPTAGLHDSSAITYPFPSSSATSTCDLLSSLSPPPSTPSPTPPSAALPSPMSTTSSPRSSASSTTPSASFSTAFSLPLSTVAKSRFSPSTTSSPTSVPDSPLSHCAKSSAFAISFFSASSNLSDSNSAPSSLISSLLYLSPTSARNLRYFSFTTSTPFANVSPSCRTLSTIFCFNIAPNSHGGAQPFHSSIANSRTPLTTSSYHPASSGTTDF